MHLKRLASFNRKSTMLNTSEQLAIVDDERELRKVVKSFAVALRQLLGTLRKPRAAVQRGFLALRRRVVAVQKAFIGLRRLWVLLRGGIIGLRRL